MPESERIDLHNTIEKAVLQLRKEVPQEQVVGLFQNMVRTIALFKFMFLTEELECAAGSIHASRNVRGRGH